MNNSFGIYDKSYSLIIETLKRFPAIHKAVMFGSRAMGNYKKGSDIDIAIFGDHISFDTTSQLHTRLNAKIPAPYYIDVVDFNAVEDKDLKNHILEEGVVFFRKTDSHSLPGA